MTVYVEYVVIDNMVINTLLLLLTKFLIKAKSTKLKIFLSALLGTIFSLISPILPTFIATLIKIPLAICMIILAFKIKTTKQLLITCLTFFLCTFAFGGACFGVMQLLGINVLIQNGLSYEYKFPIGAVLLVCSLTDVLIKNIINYIFQKHENDNFILNIEIICNNKTLKKTAFLDTGNKICLDGKAISIINYKTFNELYPYINVTDILLKKQLNIKNAKYIEIESIGNSKQKILTFDADKIIVKNLEIANAKLGLSLLDFSSKTNSDVIISNKLLGD